MLCKKQKPSYVDCTAWTITCSREVEGTFEESTKSYLFDICTAFPNDVLVELFEDGNRNRIAVLNLIMKEIQKERTKQMNCRDQ